MPVVQVSQAPSKTMYTELTDRLNLENDRPTGLILHSASEKPGGEVEIVDVWDSAESIDAFTKQRLFPAFQVAGLMDQVMAQPQPVALEPFHYVS